ncbi:MAG: hypothetical protein MJ002_07185 [Paludibacteraceae bacterium]|nr:hypothetical protein [Paludibacteraceae bacterium]
MKRLVVSTVITFLLCAFVMAGGKGDYKPHFQANLDIKALGTGHLLHDGDFTILRPEGKGFDFDMPAGGPGFDVVLGCRVRDYFFIGGGVSLEWWLNADSKNHGSYYGVAFSTDDYSRFGMGYALYAAPRFYIPTKKNDVSPYFDLGLGFCQFFLMMNDHGEQQYVMDGYCHAGVGVDIHRFNISAGYQYSYSSNGYLRVGYRF